MKGTTISFYGNFIQLRRIFTIASACLLLYTIWESSSKDTSTLSLAMYIMSNYLSQINSRFSSNLNKVCATPFSVNIYFVFCTIFLFFFDAEIHLFDDKTLLFLIAILICTWTVIIGILQSFTELPPNAIERIIKSEVKKVDTIFDESLNEIQRAVKDAGGWQAYSQTEDGQAFIRAIKTVTHPKWPTDFRKTKRKKK